MISSAKLQKYLHFWLDEDIPYWDVSSIVVPSSLVEARVIAKQKGIVAGINFAPDYWEFFSVECHPLIKDGTLVTPQQELCRLKGKLTDILQGERIFLNLIGRMSGIATLTRQVVETVKKIDPRIRIAATRKTMPGLRIFDKYAVYIGGGDTHRLSLSDQIMLKDNHLAVFPTITDAIAQARKSASFAHKIEVEVSTIEEAVEAAQAGADIVMLDNFDVPTVRECILVLTKQKLRNKILVEASGNITPQNITEYASTGVDIISLGYLTHSVKNFDVSLKIIEKKY